MAAFTLRCTAACMLILGCSAATTWLVPAGDCSTMDIRVSVDVQKNGTLWLARDFPGRTDPLLSKQVKPGRCSWRSWDLATSRAVTCQPYQAESATRYICSVSVDDLLSQHPYVYAYTQTHKMPPLKEFIPFVAPKCGASETQRLSSCGLEYDWVPEASTVSKLFFVADVGQTTNSVGVATALQESVNDVASARCIGRDTDIQCFAGFPTAVVLGGDSAYGVDGSSVQWDSFLDLLAPVLFSRVPVWFAPGNHDLQYDNEDAYMIRFGDPGPLEARPKTQCREHPYSAVEGKYFSFDVGLIHAVALCPYCGFEADSEQMQYVTRDMECIDRDTTPFLVGISHAPWYTSSSAHPHDGDALRGAFEPIFLAAGMDLLLAGHIHSVEVTTPRPDSDTGIVHITAGHGGVEDAAVFNNVFETEAPSWSRHRKVTNFGFTAVTGYANGTASVKIYYLDPDPEPPSSTTTETGSRVIVEYAVTLTAHTPTPASTATVAPSPVPPSSSSTPSPSSTPTTPSTLATPSASQLLTPSPTASETAAPSMEASVSPSAQPSGAASSPSPSVSASPSSETSLGPTSSPSEAVVAPSPSGNPDTSPSRSASRTPKASRAPPGSADDAGGDGGASSTVTETVPAVIGVVAILLLISAAYSWWKGRRGRPQAIAIEDTTEPQATPPAGRDEFEVTAQDVDLALDSDDEHARLALTAPTAPRAVASAPAHTSQTRATPAPARPPRGATTTAADSDRKPAGSSAVRNARATRSPPPSRAQDSDAAVAARSRAEKAPAPRASSERRPPREPAHAAPTTAAAAEVDDSWAWNDDADVGDAPTATVVPAPSRHLSAEAPAAAQTRATKPTAKTPAGGTTDVAARSTTATTRAGQPESKAPADSIALQMFEPTRNGSGWDLDDDFDLT